ncbi:uncharacterized protein Tco025E_02706 [Trypanosoma conorhini]|uniref:Uncharacterized protein n=1 Tax=Trypanosoma conorhini TaxID=83891 RepID=A0A3R7NLS8_9TRYP|nr:uncharacterized protein Tco025E_02706 [Trypanosoma conorhini]RNF23805.1 hypothetical protein Tco025E_02706 [Trypanosoma conorhini]
MRSVQTRNRIGEAQSDKFHRHIDTAVSHAAFPETNVVKQSSMVNLVAHVRFFPCVCGHNPAVNRVLGATTSASPTQCDTTPLPPNPQHTCRPSTGPAYYFSNTAVSMAAPHNSTGAMRCCCCCCSLSPSLCVCMAQIEASALPAARRCDQRK